MSEEVDPPENFRQLSVAPTVDDLNNPNPYLRPCNIQSPYHSVEHYLDVQFRLLREDFISPLRNGLTEYLENGQRFKNNDFRVYKNVKLIPTAEINKSNNVGIKISFGVLKNVRWEDSKRFMFGGLVLLSSDSFNTIIFCTIMDRDEKKLKDGYIIVQPIEQTDITRKMYDYTYVMLESKIYFEPYQAVLSAMRLMDESNFPMKKYIVDASTSIKLPKYLQNKSLFSEIDTPWQASQKRRLDSSQYNAFKHALTEEFAVIQGPPGTGKTFIALEIVETLLQNKKLWLKYGPIVVVCFTNHALDQFLEGILLHTKSIIRIGQRSKSEKLQQYTLRERRQLFTKSQNYRSANAKARKKLFEAKKNLENVLSELSSIHRIVEYLTTSEAIVPLECLTKYCHHQTLRNMKSNENLVSWLTGEKLNIVFQKSENAQLGQLNDKVLETAEDQQEDAQMDDFFELTYKIDVPDGFKLTFPMKDIDSKIELTKKKIKMLRENITPTNPNNDIYKVEINQREFLKNTLIQEQKILKEEFSKHPVKNSKEKKSQNPRWKMYWGWVLESYEKAVLILNNLKKQFDQKNRELNVAKEIVDIDILKQHEIIGLTTTAAAKLHVTLHGLHAPIVLVEEAAEILESHIVCSMTKDCQHVILIGDHKQLRPKPSDYKIGKDFNLEVSLFERMVNVRGNCNQLTCQHRMRPEIVNLITPSIYSSLNNHKTVYDFPNVRGLDKNLFFFNHENSEFKHNEESWTNQFEAKFLITFARHLVKQGYEPNEITVLCTYIGQLFELRKEKNKISVLKNLYITTVDNFQGEENRIILLSLVRNNGEGNTGFLKQENRVCVALSRAREGLYIMGNINDLIVKNKIWPVIKKTLEDQEAIGNNLNLRCQNHPEQLIIVKDANDFQQCPEGGCLKICNSQLNCGHTCTSVCHILDKEHKKYHCRKPCIKSCLEGHPCPLMCFEGCKPCNVKVKCTLTKCKHEVEKPCYVDENDFPCYNKIKAVLPDCKHEVEKPCYLPIEKFKCTHPCEYRVERCGHSCVQNCHVNKDPEHIEYKCKKECPKECENQHACKQLCYQECVPCPVIMSKKRSCGHFYPKVLCYVRLEELYCAKRCEKILDCGHKCPQKCSDPCGNCPKIVKKISTCGHEVSVKCSEEATSDKCSGPCQKKLQICGHPCKKRCKDPCTTKCEELSKINIPGLCGHVFSVPCYLRNEGSKSRAFLKYCNEPCKTRLQCEHMCAGTCGKCLQGRIHVQCQAPCSKDLFCGHPCSIPCKEECRPCNKPCQIKCPHNKCNLKCGFPCTPCSEKCTLGCEHKKCTKKCSQECNIEPCNEPCKKLIPKCNHPCTGFCGDPCPPVCRICDEAELSEELSWYGKDLDDARYIYLKDCGHSIENDVLLQTLRMDSADETKDEVIQMKVCFKCKTPILTCMRVIKQVKERLSDILTVKQRIFSNHEQLKDTQKKYIETLAEIKGNKLMLEFEELEVLLKKMMDRGALVNVTVANQKRKQELNFQEMDAFKVKVDILQQILKILSSIKNKNASVDQHIKEQVSLIVRSIPEEWLITKQNLDDIQLELARLHYLVEIGNVYASLGNTRSFTDLLEKVTSVERFTSAMEIKLKIQFQKIQNLEIERKNFTQTLNTLATKWYKCPNGHFYAVGNCGGLNQRGKCVECESHIGGGSRGSQPVDTETVIRNAIE